MLSLQQLCGQKLFENIKPNAPDFRDNFRKQFHSLEAQYPHSMHKIIPPGVVRDCLVPLPREESEPYFSSLSQLETLDITSGNEDGNMQVQLVCELMKDKRIVKGKVLENVLKIRELVLDASQFNILWDRGFPRAGEFPFVNESDFTRLRRISIEPHLFFIFEFWREDEARRFIDLANQDYELTIPVAIDSIRNIQQLKNVGIFDHKNIKISLICITDEPVSQQESLEVLGLAEKTEKLIIDHGSRIRTLESRSLQSLNLNGATNLERLDLPNAHGNLRLTSCDITEFNAPFIDALWGDRSQLPHLNLRNLTALALKDCDWTPSASPPSELYFPNVTLVSMINSFPNLTSLIVPKAECIHLASIPLLSSIVAPEADEITLFRCPAVTRLEALDRIKYFSAKESRVVRINFSSLTKLILRDCTYESAECEREAQMALWSLENPNYYSERNKMIAGLAVVAFTFLVWTLIENAMLAEENEPF